MLIYFYCIKTTINIINVFINLLLLLLLKFFIACIAEKGNVTFKMYISLYMLKILFDSFSHEHVTREHILLQSEHVVHWFQCLLGWLLSASFTGGRFLFLCSFLC
jgi:hypothetical protein